MDRASSLIFPGSRTLAGWWRQLQAFQPQALHVGYVHLHRVEAPVEVLQNEPVDSFTRLLLQALRLDESETAKSASAAPEERLAHRLGLPRSVVRQTLLGMQKKGLLTREGAFGSQATALGNAACEQGHFPSRGQQRRVLTFLEHLDPSGARLSPPRFLPFTEFPSSVWHPESRLGFDPSWLQECLDQSQETKARLGIPLDMERVVRDGAAPDWQHVLVDRPERSLVVLLLANQPGRWISLAARANGWTLNDREPVLQIPESAFGKHLPFVDEPGEFAWQEAWRSWCRQRNFPANEVEECRLSYRSPRLEITAPEHFIQRLRASKSDLLQDEAWLLVGDGYLRTAALLTLAETA